MISHYAQAKASLTLVLINFVVTQLLINRMVGHNLQVITITYLAQFTTSVNKHSNTAPQQVLTNTWVKQAPQQVLTNTWVK